MFRQLQGGHRRALRGAYLALALAVGPGSFAGAGPSEVCGDARLARRLAEFEAVPVLAAHFVEKRYLKVLEEPLVNRGEIWYARPDRLLWQVKEPARATLLVEEDRLRIGAEGQVRDIPMAPPVRAFVDGFRLLLAGDPGTLCDLYDTSARLDGERWTVRLTPRAPELREFVREVEIEGQGRRPERLRVLDVRGDEVLTRFREVRFDDIPSPATWERRLRSAD